MRPFIVIFLLLFSSQLFAQKDLLLDKDYKPVATMREAVYIGTITNKDGLYFRELYYTSGHALASQAWFKDKDAKIPHGEHLHFYSHRLPHKHGVYADGKKAGIWKTYHPNGVLKDSFTYVNGFLSGTQYSFFSDGYVSDSMQFDGKGNGAQVGWYPEGSLFYAGLWTMDTVKKGRWKYYHQSGQVRATEDYTEGKLVAAACFDEKGNNIDTASCTTRESEFSGDWRRFLARAMNPSVPVDNGAKDGQYTVLAMFEVEKDGSLSNITTFTRHGYGMEQEVIRVLKASPKWKPALRVGVPVRTFKIQPLTFIVSSQ